MQLKLRRIFLATALASCAFCADEMKIAEASKIKPTF